MKAKVDEAMDGTEVSVPPIRHKYTIRPLSKWVLIRKKFRQEKVEDGVILPGGTQSQHGEVIAAAEGLPLEPGMLVIFTAFPMPNRDIEDFLDERDVFLVRFEEVFAVIEPCPS